MAEDQGATTVVEQTEVQVQTPERGVVSRNYTIPLERLLQCYREHLDKLIELTEILTPAALSEFSGDIRELLATISPEAASLETESLDGFAEPEPAEQEESRLLLAAVKRNPDSIRHMRNLPESILIVAVDRMGTVIKHIPNPSEAVQMAAVRRNPWAVKRIKQPTEAVIAYVLEKEPGLARYFERMANIRQQRQAFLQKDGKVSTDSE